MNNFRPGDQRHSPGPPTPTERHVEARSPDSVHRRPHPGIVRRGIVMVLVLAMLSLFSILVAGYVLFANQAASIMPYDPIPAVPEVDLNALLNQAREEITHGSEDANSALFGHSLLDDLYGADNLSMTVAFRNAALGTSHPFGQTVGDVDSRSMLLETYTLTGVPPTPPDRAFFKIATSVAPWSETPFTTPDIDASLDLDDWATGRFITMVEGPLEGVTFTILRSFARDGGPGGFEGALAGSVVVDLAESDLTEIYVGDVPRNLFAVAQQSPQDLFFEPGPDELPGRGGFDDDGDGVTDERDELGYPGSDDEPYELVISGTMFNGNGINATGDDGTSRFDGTTVNVVDNVAPIELQYNATLGGASLAAGESGTDRAVEMDEPWDAADYENLFLAWQPSDHRSPGFGGIYSGGNAADLNAALGSAIIPSFHRPAVINYLINAPIPLPQANAALAATEINDATRTFWAIREDFGVNGTLQAGDAERLQHLCNRLRRATMRPLNFEHAPAGNPIFNDLDGDGTDDDGAPEFTGSNPVPIAGEAINYSDAGTLIDQIYRLSRWLVNGPWDVDNDGDGLPDSVWIDADLPLQTAPDGSTVKPLVAVLLEDLDGRVNVNEAGNMVQVATDAFPDSGPLGYSTDAEYFDVATNLGNFGRGGGVGPADIDFSHLFDVRTTAPGGGYDGPIYNFNQLSVGLDAVNSSPATDANAYTATSRGSLLRSRYANLINVRYGGTVYDWTSTSTIAAALLRHPGDGFGFLAADAVPVSPDAASRVLFPGRQSSFTDSSTFGVPMDMFGAIQTRPDKAGNQRLDIGALPTNYPNATVVNDLFNQPYEQGIEGTDDARFEPGDLLGTLRGGSAGPLGELLSEEINRNASLRHQITTESRTLLVPEIRGYLSMTDFYVQKLAAASADIDDQLARVMPPEFRKGLLLNLNRQLGNGEDDDGDGLVDEYDETGPGLTVTEPAFPDLNEVTAPTANPEAAVAADYDSFVVAAADYSGMAGTATSPADGRELLARHLYCLMYFMVADSSVTGPAGNLFPNFPFPDTPNFTTTDAEFRNRYAARRIAQWAVNAVDMRDTDAVCTRLRYDPFLFDADGFDLTIAATAGHTLWGMERPELAITETLATHDKRLRRDLNTAASGTDTDGESSDDEAASDPDSDMDQFRIPEASGFVELQSLRSPSGGSGPSLPTELYTATGELDLGRVAGVGTTAASPVWRLAVGSNSSGDRLNSVRWMFDAERVGRKLVDADGRTAEGDYIGVADGTVEFDTDDEIVLHTADVYTEFTSADVSLQDDLSPGLPIERMTLARFVWFASLDPTGGLSILADPASGMTPANVFYNAPNQADATDPTLPHNAPTTLSPGQFALVAPRPVTRFGQQSGLGPGDNFEYKPSPQRIELSYQGAITGASELFRVDYFDTTGAGPLTPAYRADSVTPGADSGYAARSVLPIIARSAYPSEVGGGTAWTAYAGTPATQRHEIGFNISAPLAGPDYYAPPTDIINTTVGPEGRYPLVDGYRNYNGADTDFHPDAPFDYAPGGVLGANGWETDGTYQEAAAVFLQRLADPTRPWNAFDNPYVTVDLAPMDLTVFNGDADTQEPVGGSGPRSGQVADAYAGTPFTLPLTDPFRFDTRRKIPDVAEDRLSTELVCTVPPGSTPADTAALLDDLSNYERRVVTQRPGLSMAYSVLASNPPAGASLFFDRELGAMWTGTHAADDASIVSDFTGNVPYAVSNDDFWGNSTFDTAPYRQTLGFVNREFGRPAGFAPSGSDDLLFVGRSFPRGAPMDTNSALPLWADRDYQSPMALMNVPAVSRLTLNARLSSGTVLVDGATREMPEPFEHLLGFDRGVADDDANHSVPIGPRSPAVAAATGPSEELTGDRSPFELLLDLVYTGNPDFEDRRWYAPSTVTPTGAGSGVDAMYDRVVEVFQPPYNYVPRRIQSGRINVNTTPDYIRPGSTTDPLTQLPRYLDAGESAEDNATAPTTSRPAYSLVNADATTSTAYTGNLLFGNGSVFRSFAWSGSTSYDLDLYTAVSGSVRPEALGAVDEYDDIVETPFGRGFKAFIESRRGTPGALTSSSTTGSLGNLLLDHRLPTRFGGLFATSDAAGTPSVQRFLRTPIDVASGTSTAGARRRTYDMTLWRPHPDFDRRTFESAIRADFDADTNTNRYSLDPEVDPTGATVALPAATGGGGFAVDTLRMTRTTTGVFERSLPELHRDFRHLARLPEYRTENASRYANLTTPHSNVFLVRMTVGLFRVDGQNAPSEEYTDLAGQVIRGSMTAVIDRSVPVAFVPGINVNTDRTVLYQEFAQ